MTKIVWLAVTLMLVAGMTIIANTYASGGRECEGHSEEKCSHQDKCDGHAEGECSGQKECGEHAKGECAGHREERAKGECQGMMKNLSSEQRVAVHAKMKAMRAEGATQEQIHVAMKEMLKENAEVHATEIETATSTEAKKKCSHKRNWFAKAAYSVGHTFKVVAGAFVGIFS